MNEVVITALAGAATAIVGYLFGKRKISADASKTEAEAGAIVSSQWKILYEQLEKDVNSLRLQILEFRKENKELVIEVHELRKENGELRKQIDRLENLMSDEKHK